MGKSRHGYMMPWALDWTMMLLDTGAPECSIVLTEIGKKKEELISPTNISH